MADYTDTKVSQLVINNLTQEKFEELKAKGELQDDQIYCTPDTLAEQLANKADADLNNTQAFKKTGGELSGPILRDGVLARSPSETELMIKAGSDTTNEDGALFVVYGKNGYNAGSFLVRAASADGTVRDLLGKPDGSLKWGGNSVLTEAVKQTITGWGMPKYTSGVSISSGHVAQKNGFVVFTGTPNNTACNLLIDGKTVISNFSSYSGNIKEFKEIAPVGKGSTITFTGTSVSAVFYPAKGE